MSNVNELVARLRRQAETTEYVVDSVPMDQAADQIKADQKRIAELTRELEITRSAAKAEVQMAAEAVSDFEQWAERHGYDIERLNPSMYRNDDTQNLWRGWSAARQDKGWQAWLKKAVEKSE